MIKICIICCLLCICACTQESYIPKPKAYPRINLPKYLYKDIQTDVLSSKINVSAHAKDFHKKNTAVFFKLYYPTFDASIHFTYLSADSQSVHTMIEEGRKLVYEHAFRASNIEEKLLRTERFSGIFYNIEGNVASNMQFFLYNNTSFIRAALYFKTKPNYDSLKPCIAYIQKDMQVFLDNLCL